MTGGKPHGECEVVRKQQLRLGLHTHKKSSSRVCERENLVTPVAIVCEEPRRVVCSGFCPRPRLLPHHKKLADQRETQKVPSCGVASWSSKRTTTRRCLAAGQRSISQRKHAFVLARSKAPHPRQGVRSKSRFKVVMRRFNLRGALGAGRCRVVGGGLNGAESADIIIAVDEWMKKTRSGHVGKQGGKARALPMRIEAFWIKSKFIGEKQPTSASEVGVKAKRVRVGFSLLDGCDHHAGLWAATSTFMRKTQREIPCCSPPRVCQKNSFCL